MAHQRLRRRRPRRKPHHHRGRHRCKLAMDGGTEGFELRLTRSCSVGLIPSAPGLRGTSAASLRPIRLPVSVTPARSWARRGHSTQRFAGRTCAPDGLWRPDVTDQSASRHRRRGLRLSRMTSAIRVASTRWAGFRGIARIHPFTWRSLGCCTPESSGAAILGMLGDPLGNLGRMRQRVSPAQFAKMSIGTRSAGRGGIRARIMGSRDDGLKHDP